MATNLEDVAFQKSYTTLLKLCHGIDTISDKAFAENLINESLRKKCQNKDTAEEERTRLLLNALQDRVKVQPETLTRFARILSETSGLDYIGVELLKKLQEVNDEQVVPTAETRDAGSYESLLTLFSYPNRAENGGIPISSFARFSTNENISFFSEQADRKDSIGLTAHPTVLSPPEGGYRRTSAGTPPPEGGYRRTSAGTPPPEEGYRRTSAGTPPPEGGYRRTSAGTPPPEGGYRRTPASTPPPEGVYRRTSAGTPPPEGGYRRTSAGTPPPEGGYRKTSAGTPPPEGGYRKTSAGTPPPEGGYRRTSAGTPPPEGGYRRTSAGTPPPEGGYRRTSAGTPPPEGGYRRTPAGTPPPEGRRTSAATPPPEGNYKSSPPPQRKQCIPIIERLRLVSA